MPLDTHDISSKWSGDVPPDADASTLDYSQGVLDAPCSPFFDELRKQLGPFLVDKTALIEKIVNNGLKAQVHLVLRPRRCGKTTMLQMLKFFFCISKKADERQLFQGLYIAKKDDLCRKHMGKYAVLFLDMKNIVGDSWKQMFLSFREMVSGLYEEWYGYLWDSLSPDEREYFEFIRLNKAAEEVWTHSLKRLCAYLARKSQRKVMVLIDEYEAPNNRAYGQEFFKKANEFFGRDILPPLLKTNPNLQYAVLAGVTPNAKSGYSGLNNLDIHALHTQPSMFAGMLMFMEEEVMTLRRLSKSELDPADLKAHYNSYHAAGVISVYNPISIMLAFRGSKIKNFWVATGEFPLLRRNISEDFPLLKTIEMLLTGAEVSLQLRDDVTFNKLTLSKAETLTLLNYAGYLTTKTDGKCRIPNREVMADWATWITRSLGIETDILDVCVEGPVNSFVAGWPQFMQHQLHPKIVAKERGATSHKTPERVYQVYLYGLFHALRLKGWEITIEPRGGSGYIDIRLVSKTLQTAVLIELKSSEKKQDIEKDSLKALDQIERNNYRNPVGLPNVHTLREYGIASYHLESCVKGRYLELDSWNEWVEKDDPAMET